MEDGGWKMEKSRKSKVERRKQKAEIRGQRSEVRNETAGRNKKKLKY
jgi:hypothetical protein